MTDGGLRGMRDPPQQRELPEWVIEKAKENADLHNADEWWPFIRGTIQQCRVIYGSPLPERDPRRERKRRQAVEAHRVLDPERFVENRNESGGK